MLEKYDEVQIFVGENYDMDAGFGYCYQKEQEDAGPTFFFFHDGLRLEKFWSNSGELIPFAQYIVLISQHTLNFTPSFFPSPLLLYTSIRSDYLYIALSQILSI